MIAVVIGILSVLACGRVFAESPGSFTAGAMIRFPSDNVALPSTNTQTTFNNGVQGLRYFATGPLAAAESQYKLHGAVAANPHAAPAYIPDKRTESVGLSAYDVHEHQKEYVAAQRPASQSHFQNSQKKYPHFPPQPFLRTTRVPYNHHPTYSPVYKPSTKQNNRQPFGQSYPKYESPQSLQVFTYGPPKENPLTHRPRKQSVQRPKGPKYHQHKDYSPVAAGSAIYGTPWNGGKRQQAVTFTDSAPLYGGQKQQGVTMADGTPFDPQIYNTITEQMLGLKNHRSKIAGHAGQRFHVGFGGNSQDKYILQDDDDAAYTDVGLEHGPTFGGIQWPKEFASKSDLAGGRSAGSSSWMPMNAPEGAVPARAYHIAAPDLSRRSHFNAIDDFGSSPDFPAAIRFQRTPEMTAKRVGESGNSEEVVSAVVLVKQKK